MGITDSMWGQRVFSLLVLKQNSETKFDEKEFTDWCKLRNATKPIGQGEQKRTY